MIRYAKLPLAVPLADVQEEVRSLPQYWQAHFNVKHYEGEWTVLPLRSAGGSGGQIIPDAMNANEQGFADTALMDRCPAIRGLMETLHCPKMAIRLMNLKAGAVIKEHRDFDLSFEKGEARIHIPVFTNPAVVFRLDGETLPMREGECWYINANLPHSVSNEGSTDRIHLVVDCVVNEWVADLFARSVKSESEEKTDHDTTRKIIQELRLQNTPAAEKLAVEMEMSISNIIAGDNNSPDQQSF